MQIHAPLSALSPKDHFYPLTFFAEQRKQNLPNFLRLAFELCLAMSSLSECGNFVLKTPHFQNLQTATCPLIDLFSICSLRHHRHNPFADVQMWCFTWSKRRFYSVWLFVVFIDPAFCLRILCVNFWLKLTPHTGASFSMSLGCLFSLTLLIH